MIAILVVILLVGFLLWAVHAVVPMDARVRTILDAVVIVCLLIWLLNAFGVVAWVPAWRVR